ncbi:OTU domain-containing protein 6B [Moelleriella libera RCEF 2490]|uniref:OTU domain-containing protein 6B n=1 Tax=Moelleriella libera RCEF 2490 TaxID=1081109 RepID=A0A167WQQ0_9HYPO|nr:OTU domain-containing protein 6B [Moelleriella libera RCEF 2490]
MDVQTESLDHMQARHRRELKELQGRITNKKKNATKKTRKAVNDDCAEMERQLREKQALEAVSHEERGGGGSGGGSGDEAAADELNDNNNNHKDDDDDDDKTPPAPGTTTLLQRVEEKPEQKLEKVVEKLHIGDNSRGSSTALPLPATQQQQQQQQQEAPEPVKKRNRQKERLARRAAEQEAAAQKAEDEAAGMTDHRARESEYMHKMFAAHGLVEKEVDPDGHCLFSAVADQLAQAGVPLLPLDPATTSSPAGTANGTKDGEAPYRTVRRAAAEYMAAHADDFAPFLDQEEEGGQQDAGAYFARMRDTAAWGGQLELMALARRYGVEIRVVQDGRTERIGEDEGQRSGRTLWLAYYRHGYGLGEHYNSLRRKT